MDSYLNLIIHTIVEWIRFLFDRYKLECIKSVKDDNNSVRQTSKANITNRSHNFYLKAQLCITDLSILATYCILIIIIFMKISTVAVETVNNTYKSSTSYYVNEKRNYYSFILM